MMKMIKDYWFVPSLLALVALIGFAVYKAPVYKIDLVKYKQEYYQCINNLPVGPNTTVYNDWDEVMEECQYIARRLSQYCSNC